MRVIEGVSHIVVAVSDLDGAARDYAVLLGAQAERFTDANGRACAWFDAGNIAFVLVAGGERAGLEGLVFRVADLDRACTGLSRCGLSLGPSVEATGPHNQRWRETPIEPESSHGFPVSLAQRDPGAGGSRDRLALDHVVIRTPNPERAVALCGGRLGLDMRLDRSNPAWNARLMFFRCGDLVVELAHVLSDGVSDAPDTFGGLSWRVPDIEATHERLTKAGFSLSPVRTGRRPGSRVCTVRDRTAGVPTILLGIDQPSP